MNRMKTQGITPPLAFVYDSFTRPLASEVMSRLASIGTTNVWVSEFSSQEEKRREIESTLGERTRALFLSLDRHVCAVSTVLGLKKYAMRLASERRIPCGIHIEALRTLQHTTFEDELLRAGIALVVLEEEKDERDLRAMFPNLAYFVHAPGMTQTHINTVALRIRQLMQ